MQQDDEFLKSLLNLALTLGEFNTLMAATNQELQEVLKKTAQPSPAPAKTPVQPKGRNRGRVEHYLTGILPEQQVEEAAAITHTLIF